MADANASTQRAQRDALKLLAAMLQHTDSKSQQQRLLCLDEPAEEEPDDVRAALPDDQRPGAHLRPLQPVQS